MQAQTAFDALTPDEKASLVNSLARSANFQETNNAAQAVKNVTAKFNEIHLKLVLLTILFFPAAGWLVQFLIIRTLFIGTIFQSIDLANISARRAVEFDDLIVKICDPELPVSTRINLVQVFRLKNGGFQIAVKILESHLDSVKDSFRAFVAQFPKLPSGAKQEIRDLHQQLESLVNNISGTKLPSSVGAPVVVTAGGIADVTSSLTVTRKKSTELRHTLKEGGLRSSHVLDLFKPAGQDDLDVVIANIFLIETLWVVVENDTIQVELWLKEGADWADYPKYMKYYLEEGATLYKNMSVYLKAYADQISELYG